MSSTHLFTSLKLCMSLKSLVPGFLTGRSRVFQSDWRDQDPLFPKVVDVSFDASLCLR